MNFYVGLLVITLIIWGSLCVVMLPVYYFRRRKNPNDKRNTLKALFVKGFLASIFFVFIFYGGLIMMDLSR